MMRRELLALLLLGVTLLSLAGTARAEEDDTGDEHAAETDDDEDEKGPDDISTRVFFPMHSRFGGEPRLPAGQDVDSLIGVDLAADSQPHRVQFVQAQLAALGQPETIIQNITGGFYNRTVTPGESVSMVYRFKTAKEIEPRDYTFIVLVYAVEADSDAPPRQLTAYNGTVTIVDSSSGLDMEGVGLALVLAALGGLFWAGWTKGKKRKARAAARAPAAVREKSVTGAGSAAGKPAAAYDDEWIPKAHRRAGSGSRDRGSGRK